MECVGELEHTELGILKWKRLRAVVWTIENMLKINTCLQNNIHSTPYTSTLIFPGSNILHHASATLPSPLAWGLSEWAHPDQTNGRRHPLMGWNHFLVRKPSGIKKEAPCARHNSQQVLKRSLPHSPNMLLRNTSSVSCPGKTGGNGEPLWKEHAFTFWPTNPALLTKTTVKDREHSSM